MDTKNIAFNIPGPNACTISYFNEVNAENANTFINNLNTMHNDLSNLEETNNFKLKNYFQIAKTNIKYGINVNLSTPGGYVYDGLAICDYIKNINNERPIKMTATGLVASMGVPIFLSVPVEQRVATANASFMIHSVSNMTWGKMQDLVESVEETARLQKILFDMILKNTSITSEKLQDVNDKKQDWFLSADEALELGIISKII